MVMIVVMVMRELWEGNRGIDGWMHCLLIFPMSPPLLDFVSYREDDDGDEEEEKEEEKEDGDDGNEGVEGRQQEDRWMDTLSLDLSNESSLARFCFLQRGW